MRKFVTFLVLRFSVELFIKILAQMKSNRIWMSLHFVFILKKHSNAIKCSAILGTAMCFTLWQKCIFVHILPLLLVQTENIFG